MSYTSLEQRPTPETDAFYDNLSIPSIPEQRDKMRELERRLGAAIDMTYKQSRMISLVQKAIQMVIKSLTGLCEAIKEPTEETPK